MSVEAEGSDKHHCTLIAKTQAPGSGDGNEECDLEECLRDVLSQQAVFVKATEMLCEKVKKIQIQTGNDMILMEHVRKKYEKNISVFSNEVHLNIGGARFTTSKDTLLAEPDNFFACMVRR
jgi:hypothetical protein